MKRARTERLVFGTVAVLAGAMVPVFASCAEAQDSRPTDVDAQGTWPDANERDASEASVDAGCDASDPSCNDGVLTCDDAPWCPTPTSVSTAYALTAVWGSGPSDVWAVGSGGTIAHYDGTNWTTTPTSVRATFRAVWGTGPNDVWAVAMTDAIFHTTGYAAGAAKWVRVSDAETKNPRATYAIWGTSAGEVRIGSRSYTVNIGGEFLPIGQYALKHSAEDDITWTPVPGDGTVLGFWGNTSDDLWVVADNSERNGWEKGLTKHATASRDGEIVWQKVDSQSPATLRAIWGSSPDDIWAVGDGGTIRHMTKGQKRWEIVASPTTTSLHGLWGTAANDIWAVGESGTILHFDGTEWKPSLAAFAPGKRPNLYGVWGSTAGDVWIVGDVTLHYTGPKGGHP